MSWTHPAAFREITWHHGHHLRPDLRHRKRRRRKRGTMVDPAKRVVINELVCEGCGDCSVQNNCISVEPLETEFGRKRTINQSTCNKDFSCVKGFCPSLSRSKAANCASRPKGKAAAAPDGRALPPADPDYAGVGLGHHRRRCRRHGVITIGQLLGVAAHLEGKGIVTQDAAGLAQKGEQPGAMCLLPRRGCHPHHPRRAGADLVIGCDPVVVAGKETCCACALDAPVALNAHGTPTAAFVTNPDWRNPVEDCPHEIGRAVGDGSLGTLLRRRHGHAAAGRQHLHQPIMLGYAWQKGWIPLEWESCCAPSSSTPCCGSQQGGFEWGACRHRSRCRAARAGPGRRWSSWAPRNQASVDELVARRKDFSLPTKMPLYAAQYVGFVAVRRAEQALAERKPTDDGKTLP